MSEERVLRKSARPMGYIFPKRIRDVIQGDTPITKVGYEKQEDKTSKVSGTTWTDENGVTWKQHTGWTERISKLENVRNEINSVIKAPSACPRCGGKMTGKFDEKFWILRKTCFECVVKEESHLRATGQYSAYETGIMIDNAIAYFKDIKNQMEDYVKTQPATVTYIEEDGRTESWNTHRVVDMKTELQDLEDMIVKLELEKEELTKKV